MEATTSKKGANCPPATLLSVIGEDVKGNGIKFLDESGSTTTAVSICTTKSEINNSEFTKRNTPLSTTAQATSTAAPQATVNPTCYFFCTGSVSIYVTVAIVVAVTFAFYLVLKVLKKFI